MDSRDASERESGERIGSSEGIRAGELGVWVVVLVV